MDNEFVDGLARKIIEDGRSVFLPMPARCAGCDPTLRCLASSESELQSQNNHQNGTGEPDAGSVHQEAAHAPGSSAASAPRAVVCVVNSFTSLVYSFTSVSAAQPCLAEGGIHTCVETPLARPLLAQRRQRYPPYQHHDAKWD